MSAGVMCAGNLQGGIKRENIALFGHRLSCSVYFWHGGCDRRIIPPRRLNIACAHKAGSYG